ncbi:unnamed protein product [marine sediment metagenome]|uniref:Uncharacterized protein n=1 Tax=marine sediment metagenome TaxID=412755 RepID=X1BDG8_9ZZZZ
MKVVFETQEITPEAAGNIYQLANKYCYVAIKSERYSSEELKAIEGKEFQAKGKSSSQELRGVLYVLFTQDNKGFETFDRFYKFHMDEEIDKFKNQIR